MNRSVVAIVGPPASGKTTALTDLVTQDQRFSRFNVRDFGLELFSTGHPLGLQIGNDLLDRKRLTDSLVAEEYREFLKRQCGPLQRIVLSESYPRGGLQTKSFFAIAQEEGVRVLGAVQFELPNDLAIIRAASRLTCSSCGLSQSGHCEGPCVGCKGLASRRPDDLPSRFLERLVQYRTETQELLEEFTRFGVVVRVNSDAPKEVVSQTTAAHVLSLLSGSL
jgi:adenylate kinase family enzyme